MNTLTYALCFLIGHATLSLAAVVCLAAGLSCLTKNRAGFAGLIRGYRISRAVLLASASLLLLDGAAAWRARTANADGYGLVYPVAAALLLAPTAACGAIFALVFWLMARRQ